jgi:hypothetical protein
MRLARENTKGDLLSSLTWILLQRRPFNELIGTATADWPAAAVLELRTMARSMLPAGVSEGIVHDWLAGIARTTPLSIAFAPPFADTASRLTDEDALLEPRSAGRCLRGREHAKSSTRPIFLRSACCGVTCKRESTTASRRSQRRCTLSPSVFATRRRC